MTDATAPRRRGRRALWLSALGVLVLLLIAAGWVGVRAVLVKAELEALVPLSKDMQAAVHNRDLDALSKSAAELDERAARADALTGDPVWRVFEIVPWLGPNLTAVRVTSSELAATSRDAVTPIVALAVSAGAENEPDARALLDVLSAAREPLARAANTLTSASSALDDIDTAQVVEPLAKGVTALREVVDEAAPGVTNLSDVSQVLPGLLGANGPRSVLLMFQNNAELRTGGGITGTFALLSVADGSVQMVQQFDSSDFGRRASPILDVPESTSALYGDVVGRFVQNTTMTADFTLSAQLATTWWTQEAPASGSAFAAPDAVLSIDPDVLRSLLAATGPITLPDGSEISADNIIQRLLVDPYMTLDSDSQTAFFEQVTAAALGQFVTSLGDPLTMMSAFAGPVSEGRISLWSADPAEQRVLEKTPLAGAAARQSAAGADAYAVYFNDATGGKMDTFMDTRIGVGSAQCTPDGLSEVRVSVTLRSTAPADAGTTFPVSMTGGGVWGTGEGDIGMNVSVSAPPGTYLGGVTLDGVSVGATDVVDGGFTVSSTRANLPPGEQKTLVFSFIAAQPGIVKPTILHTPMITQPVIEEITVPCT